MQNGDSRSGGGEQALRSDEAHTILPSRRAPAGAKRQMKIHIPAAFLPRVTGVRPLHPPPFPSGLCIEEPENHSTALVRHVPPPSSTRRRRQSTNTVDSAATPRGTHIGNHDFTPTGPHSAANSYFPTLRAPQTPQHSTHSLASDDQLVVREETVQCSSSSSRTSIVDRHRVTESFQSPPAQLPRGRENKETLFHEAMTWPELWDQLQGNEERLKAVIQNFDQVDAPVEDKASVYHEWKTFERLAVSKGWMQTTPIRVYAGKEFQTLNRLKLWLRLNLHWQPRHTWPPHYKTPFRDDESERSSVYFQDSHDSQENVAGSSGGFKKIPSSVRPLMSASALPWAARKSTR
ncbi:MAG: hypothetical protein LQ346_003155 [Caloplaca aetnensis]|nr:MAG: hypothetical protein LQ346_003155 [Caloplaca aetnensis]